MASSNIGSVILTSYPQVQDPFSSRLYKDVAFSGVWTFKLDNITYGFLQYLDDIHLTFYLNYGSRTDYFIAKSNLALSGNTSYTFSINISFDKQLYQGGRVDKIELRAYRKDGSDFGQGTYSVRMQNGTAINPYTFPAAPYLGNLSVPSPYLCDSDHSNYAPFSTILTEKKDAKKFFKISLKKDISQVNWSDFEEVTCTIASELEEIKEEVEAEILSQPDNNIVVGIEIDNNSKLFNKLVGFHMEFKLKTDVRIVYSEISAYGYIIADYSTLKLTFSEYSVENNYIYEKFKISFGDDIESAELYPTLCLNETLSQTNMYEDYIFVKDGIWKENSIYEWNGATKAYDLLDEPPLDWKGNWYSYYIKGNSYPTEMQNYQTVYDNNNFYLYIIFQMNELSPENPGYIINSINRDLKIKPNINISAISGVTSDYKYSYIDFNFESQKIGYQCNKINKNNLEDYYRDSFSTKLENFIFLNRGKPLNQKIGLHCQSLDFTNLNGRYGSTIEIGYNLSYEGKTETFASETLTKKIVMDNKTGKIISIDYENPLNFIYEKYKDNKIPSGYKQIWNEKNEYTQILEIKPYFVFKWEDGESFKIQEADATRTLRLNRLIEPELPQLKCNKNYEVDLKFTDPGLDESKNLNLDYFEILTDSTMKKYGDTEKTLSIYNIEKIILKLIINDNSYTVEKEKEDAQKFITSIIKGETVINIKNIFNFSEQLKEKTTYYFLIEYVYHTYNGDELIENALSSHKIDLIYTPTSAIQTISLRKNQVGINGEPKYGASIYTEKFELDDIVSDIAILGDLVIQLSTGKIYRKDSNGDKYVYDGKINDAPPTTEKEYLKVKNQACINGEPKYGASIYTETSNLSDITILGKMVIQLSTGEIYREDKNGDKYVYNGKINDDAPGTGIEYLKVLKII